MNATTQTNRSNLHVSGIGYLNRFRWLQPKQAGRKAQPFLACSVSALRGNAESPDYTYLDLRVCNAAGRGVSPSLSKVNFLEEPRTHPAGQFRTLANAFLF